MCSDSGRSKRLILRTTLSVIVSADPIHSVCTTTTGQGPGDQSCAAGLLGFPRQIAVDYVEQVGLRDSYSYSLELTKNGIMCGPSSGLNLKGLLQFIENRKNEGSLSSLAGPDGNIHCVFLCCDLPPDSSDK